MTRLHFIIVFISVVFTWVKSYGQQHTFLVTSDQPILFLNKSTNQFCVIDDSLKMNVFDGKLKKWKTQPIHFAGECSFDSFKRNYIPVTTPSGLITFISYGVGEVYQLLNDTIKRIDRSFKHMNQFGGTFFSFEDRIYCFGGYGLFTFKNILTHYSFKHREWFVDDLLYDQKKPSPRAGAFCQQVGNVVYMIGGSSNNSVDNIQYTDVWKYNLVKPGWEKLGNVPKEVISPSKMACLWALPYLETPFVKFGQDYVRIDIHNNTLSFYKPIRIKNSIYLLTDKKENDACIVSTGEPGQRLIQVIPINQLVGSPISVIKLYRKNSSSYYMSSWWVFVLPSFLLIAVGSFIIWRVKKKTKRAIINEQNGIYYLGQNRMDAVLNHLAYTVLMAFIESPDHSLEIADINRLLEYDEPTPDTVKKRRENCLKNIKEKLAAITTISQDEIFLEERHPKDRRIKIVKLNPNLLD